MHIVIFKPDHVTNWMAMPTVYRDLKEAQKLADEIRHDRNKSRVITVEG